MSAIEAASVGMKTMADGTLRLSVDIEPRFAKEAFGLFGAPGTPLAVAALRIGAPEPELEPEKPKGGELSKWVAMRCNETEFQRWLAHEFFPVWNGYERDQDPSEIAADVVRCLCGVESRAEIDTNPHAKTLFLAKIRGPWMKHSLAKTA